MANRGPRITELDIVRFTEGDCHILARVLHEVTGWPTHALHDGYNKEPNLHAFVYSEGLAIDVRGAQPVDQLLAQWEYAEGIVQTEDIDWGRAIFSGSWRRARTIAPLLVLEGEQQ